ncbi:MAG: PIG-L family deacetylase [Sedimentisphaerales bacterium]|nr:PIG-L family deacetylase [Sedimentisphaerales bacterium]
MDNPTNQPASESRRTGATGQGWDFHNCAIIVAHPDDEILWAGGLMLLHHETRWTVMTLCRKSDLDRSAKFNRVMEYLGAKGVMGDLDDGPEQKPLVEKEIKKTILSLLPMDRFDLVLTHSRWGEYTRNLRHEETSRAVTVLFNTKELFSKQLWMFAYEDGGGKYLPKPSRDADFQVWLPDKIWQEKYRIVTEMYGFAPDSFEAKCCPKQETFWRLGAK